MKYRLCLILGTLLFAFQQSHSQNIYNSPYSVYGVGMLNKRTSSLNRGMAGTGIAVQDEFNLNHVNPASYGSITNPISHIFELGLYVESNQFKSRTLSDSKSNGGITTMNYWFKLNKWWASTLGLSPFSSMSYKISQSQNLGAITNVDYQYEGTGNISEIYWGNSFNVVKNLSIGANVSFLFGSLSKNESIATGASQTIRLEDKVTTNKFHIDFGAQYAIHLGERKLVVGVTADNGLKFNGKNKYILSSNSDTLNNTKGEDRKYRLPRNGGFGLALHTKRSIIAADLKYENWKDDASFPENQNTRFEDSWKIGVGYEYKGDPNATNFLGLIGLRGGFYTQNYYMRVNGATFDQWGLAGGLSIPVFDNKSSINLTYTYDRLGTDKNNLILQTSQKIALEVVMRDLWGIRRKFD